MENPRVSVILPVKNAARYLTEALDSVVASDFKSFEIVVVDGNSTDDTREIALSYEPVRFLNQTGVGLSDAWNTGIDAARGEFVSFIGADDIWEPNKMSLQVEYLTRHPEIQLVYTMVTFFQDEGSDIPSAFNEELLSGIHVGRFFESLMLRRSLYQIVGQLSTDYVVAGDVEWHARVVDRDVPLAVLPEVLVRKRVHEDNLSTLEEMAVTYQRELVRSLRESVKRKQLPRREEAGR